MSYFTGDVPAEDLTIEPARNGEPIDLTPFDSVVVTLRDDIGAVVEGSGLLATIDLAMSMVVVEWPTDSPFATSGIYYLGLVLENATTHVRERVTPIPLVVEDEDTGWLTLDGIRDSWPDAPTADLDLFEILWTAKQQVIDYAPALAAGERPPLNYKTGQKMQARNIWNATKVDPSSGGVGDGSFVIRPFPLDWMVKQQLRPATAVPRVG